MKKLVLTSLVSLFLVACGDQASKTAELPAAQMLSDQSIGHYCMMNLNEHIGPKAQLFVKSQEKPFWFSTVKQMFMFRILPEEPKDIVAMYVTDMAKVTDWSHANADSDWIDATKAFYVIKSKFVGGMGAEDALPFSDKTKAEAFAKEHGGEVVTFEQMPEDYVAAQGMSVAQQHHAAPTETMSHAAHAGHHMPQHGDASQTHSSHEGMHHAAPSVEEKSASEMSHTAPQADESAETHDASMNHEGHTEQMNHEGHEAHGDHMNHNAQ